VAPAVLVEFSPASAEMHIRATPRVALADAPTGSNLRLPLINAQVEIEKAWRNALTMVPKPDPAQLDNQAIELSLDVAMTIEVGREVSFRTAQAFRPLAPVELMSNGPITKKP
jgi:hypothetical protein